jgi:hypothetical protein
VNFDDDKFSLNCRIPKKSEKVDPKSTSRRPSATGSSSTSSSSLQKPSKAGNLKPGQYNHSYNKRPPGQQQQQQQKSHLSQLGGSKRSFEDDIFKAFDQPATKKFDVLDVIAGMKTLKKEEKKDNIVPKEPKLAASKQQPQNHQKTPPRRRTPSPTPPPAPRASKEDKDLENLLSAKVKDRNGREFFALTTWQDRELLVFKCWVCHVQVDGKTNLFTHLGGYRHRTNKSKFTEIKSNSSNKDLDANSWGGGSSSASSRGPPPRIAAPHFRVRKEPQAEKPWEFSPSEAVNDDDDYNADTGDGLRTPPAPMDDDYLMGGDDSPVMSNSEQQRRPQVASGSSSSFSLPKPVPSLPKPVPSAIKPTNILNSSLFQRQGTSVPNSDLFASAPWQQPPQNQQIGEPIPRILTESHGHHDDEHQPQHSPEQPPIFEAAEDNDNMGVSPPHDHDGVTPPIADDDLFPEPPARVPKPVPAPQMVPPPKALQHQLEQEQPRRPVPVPPSKAKLSLSQLKKLPPAMSLHDRVVRGLKSTEEEDWKRAREARGKASEVAAVSSSTKKADQDLTEDEPYEPPGMSDHGSDYEPRSKTPEWKPSSSTSEKPSTIKAKEKNKVDFNIDTTKSFFDKPIVTADDEIIIAAAKPKPGGIKIKSMANLMAAPAAKATNPPSHPKTTNNKKSETSKKKGLGSFLDKVIHALKKSEKSGPSMQVPSMNMEDDDTPLDSSSSTAPPPLPPTAPPPLPDDPPPPPLPGAAAGAGTSSTGVSPPRISFDISMLNIEGSVLDDDLLLAIVSDLDKDMAEEDKLAKAKEKLAQILQRRAIEAGGRLVNPTKMTQRPGPRSRMPIPPEPAYRAGPRSRMSALNPGFFAQPPPPPPPPAPAPTTANISELEISSFMNQWSAEADHHQPNQPQEAAPEAEPTYSSALAKLRAKKAAKAAQQAAVGQGQQQQHQRPTPPLNAALQKLKKLPFAPPPDPNDSLKRLRNQVNRDDDTTPTWGQRQAPHPRSTTGPPMTQTAPGPGGFRPELTLPPMPSLMAIHLNSSQFSTSAASSKEFENDDPIGQVERRFLEPVLNDWQRRIRLDWESQMRSMYDELWVSTSYCFSVQFIAFGELIFMDRGRHV